MGETIETARGKLEDRKNWGIDTCGVFKSFFHFFPLNQTPQCPKFVKWCVDNFCVTEGVIMNKFKSKIICSVKPLSSAKPWMSSMNLPIRTKTIEKRTLFAALESLLLKVKKPS